MINEEKVRSKVTSDRCEPLRRRRRGLHLSLATIFRIFNNFALTKHRWIMYFYYFCRRKKCPGGGIGRHATLRG